MFDFPLVQLEISADETEYSRCNVRTPSRVLSLMDLLPSLVGQELQEIRNGHSGRVVESPTGYLEQDDSLSGPVVPLLQVTHGPQWIRIKGAGSSCLEREGKAAVGVNIRQYRPHDSMALVKCPNCDSTLS
jgi:hypothetical protein